MSVLMQALSAKRQASKEAKAKEHSVVDQTGAKGTVRESLTTFSV